MPHDDIEIEEAVIAFLVVFLVLRSHLVLAIIGFRTVLQLAVR